MSVDCKQVQLDYEEVVGLKTEFDFLYENISGKDSLVKAKDLKTQIEAKMELLRDKLWPFEKLPLVELRRQYDEQKEVFQNIGILKKLSNGQLGVIEGVTGDECFFPTFEQFKKDIYTKEDVLNFKTVQKFAKVSVNPIGMLTWELASKLEQFVPIYFRNKIKNGEILSRTDLMMMYEVDSPLFASGFTGDVGFKLLKNRRSDMEADAAVIFQCKKEQIAHNASEINVGTKAFIGPLTAEVFAVSPPLEYIFTTFPESRIQNEFVTIGGKPASELKKELLDQNYKFHLPVPQMMEGQNFSTQTYQEIIKLVRLSLRDLGFLVDVTFDEIRAKAKELNLKVCPIEVGPYYRLNYADQPSNESVNIFMEPIETRDYFPAIFQLNNVSQGELYLSCTPTIPKVKHDPNSIFIFSKSL